MSSSAENGGYFHSSRENELWLRDNLGDIFKNVASIQEKELSKRYKRARKYTKEQYTPWYVDGSSSAYGDFRICPIADMGNDRGVFSEINTCGLRVQFILKGSLLATDKVENLNQNHKEYLEMLMRSSYSENPVQIGKKDGVNYLAIHEQIIDGSYLVINRLVPQEMGPQAVERGLMHPEHHELVDVCISGYNNDKPIPFLRETFPTIIPGTIEKIKLVNIDGEPVNN